jgi:hypothetical protein
VESDALSSERPKRIEKVTTSSRSSVAITYQTAEGGENRLQLTRNRTY